MWPSMVPHPRNLCSAFKPSKCTHTAVRIKQTHTHCEHIPGAVGSHLYCGARGAVGGSVPCSRAPQSWYWRWRERCTFTPPTGNSCQTWDSNPWALGYRSNYLYIRPRLPHNELSIHQRILKTWITVSTKILSSITGFNINNNKNCILSIKSAYYNYL